MSSVPSTRQERLTELFPTMPSYRLKQVLVGLYNPAATSWLDVTTLPELMRTELVDQLPWVSCAPVKTFSSAKRDTHKVVLKGQDGQLFESVLMLNNREQWTICVSSQIGCAMGCTFCATGTMGLIRNLNSDEIADQYRFWQQFLHSRPQLPQRISNVVFMGMGEPLVNRASVSTAIQTWLDYTDLGPTKITVSSVGVLPELEAILTDTTWPPVRIAISLHSPEEQHRRTIVPTTAPRFHERLAAWTHDYERILGNRNHHITFEYTLISGVNDTEQEAQKLIKFVRSTAAVKVNVIPLNFVAGKEFSASSRTGVERFKKALRDASIDVTERRTMGEDIAAACGQLAINVKNKAGEVIA